MIITYILKLTFAHQHHHTVDKCSRNYFCLHSNTPHSLRQNEERIRAEPRLLHIKRSQLRLFGHLSTMPEGFLPLEGGGPRAPAPDPLGRRYLVLCREAQGAPSSTEGSFRGETVMSRFLCTP